MKKIILILVIVLGISQFAKAQTDLGGGIALWGDIGIEAKANFGITEAISISPSIDYFLIDDFDGGTFLMFNVDGHYNFEVGEGFVAYPLVGINYYHFSYDIPEYTILGVTYGGGNISDGDIDLNIGGGATYALSDSMKLYAEVKFMRSDVGLSAGILFGL